VSPVLAPPRPRRQTTAGQLPAQTSARRPTRVTARQLPTRAAVRRPPAWITVRALFAEARRRRRWRRLAGAAVTLAVVTGATAFAVTWSHHRPAAGPRPDAARSADPVSNAGRSALVAWVDGNSLLNVGDLGSRIQRVVTQANAALATPLVQSGGRVYWVDTAGTYVPGLGHWSEVIQELDLATGKVAMFQPGQSIFPSADGKQLYLSQIDNESLIEVPAAGSGEPRHLTLPAGWYLPGGLGTAIADGTPAGNRAVGGGSAAVGSSATVGSSTAAGIVVQSDPELAIRHPPVLGIWSTRTGRVKVLGRGVGADSGAVIGAYTAPGASHSLLAWMPATCRYPVNCAIRITDTSALASRTLRSPLPYGFALGGAFSPDGSQLAVFVNRSPGTGGGRVQLAIVSTRTGASRLVPGASFVIGEDVAWARWLPGGKQLIAGGADRDDIVTPATLAARPLRFRHSASGDIGYSAVVIPPRQ
jgi:hypothetical protein